MNPGSVLEDNELISELEELYPEEGCGFILTSGKWVSAPNKAKDLGQVGDEKVKAAELSFAIPLELYLKHSRELSRVVHSHCYSESRDHKDHPSISDQKHQLATALPWTIVVIRSGFFLEKYTFDLRKPELKNEYRPGINDELTILEARDGAHCGFFRDEKTINDVTEMSWLEFISRQLVLMGKYEELTEAQTPQPGDIILSGDDAETGAAYFSLAESESFYKNFIAGELVCSSQKPGAVFYKQLRKN